MALPCLQLAVHQIIFICKVFLHFMLPLDHIYSKFTFFLFLCVKQIYCTVTSYNRTAQNQHEIMSSCQLHVGTSQKTIRLDIISIPARNPPLPKLLCLSTLNWRRPSPSQTTFVQSSSWRVMF